MKNKEKTFKFVGFNERIDKIHVDVVRRFKSFSADLPQDADTFFWETLEKWSDLNGTTHFDDFKRSIPRAQLQTYAQLLHHQKQIVESLKLHLKVEQSLCLPALLDLTVSICRDLQADFYVYFWDFFEIIENLLKSTKYENIDLIDSCFTSYAYLFKFCRRKMLPELEIVFKRLLPLISHRKHYIRRFVAESLAFLIRKCRNFDGFLKCCLKKIDKDELLIEGISDLLVESMKNVRSNLHSAAPEILTCLLRISISEMVLHGFDLIDAILAKITKNVDASNLRSIFDVLLNQSIDVQIDQKANRASSTTMGVDALVKVDSQASEKLLGIWMTFCGGNGKIRRFYMDELWSKLILPSISDRKWNKSIFDLISVFWPPKQERMLFDQKRNFEKLAHILFETGKLENDVVGYLVEFLSNLLDENYDEFENLFSKFLPNFDEFFDTDESTNENRLILNLCCKYVDRKKSILDVDQMNVQKSEFEMRNLAKFVKNRLRNWNVDFGRNSNFDDSASILVISLNLNVDEEFLDVLLDFTKMLLEKSEFSSSNFCVLTYLCLKCAKRAKFNEKMVESLNLKRIGQKMSELASCLSYLRVFDEILQHFPNQFSYLTNLDVFSALEQNFFSPLDAVRTKTLEILCRLKWSTGSDAQNIFELALEAERTPLTLNTYRDRLSIYRKMGFVEYERYLPEPANQYRFAPLKILIGQLNVNFTLLTPTLNEMIESHARSQNQVEFWSIYFEIMKNCNIDQEQKMQVDEDEEERDEFWSNLTNVFELGEYESRKMPREHFRLLLLNCLQRFADLAESKSRFLSDFLINLVQKEMKSVDQNSQFIEDISIDAVKQDFSDEDRQRKSLIVRTLISCLNVFSKFSSPKNVAKNSILHQLYFELLLHGRDDIQKAALECIFTYKSSSILPYKENLLNILNEKTFKEQLILFNIDSDANVVEPDHRGEVMQIVLRLLYGRLLGKGSDAYRKQQIYRFLAGSSKMELSTFIDFLFQPVRSILIENNRTLPEMCESILKNFDPKMSIPLRKLGGILSHLSMVIRKLGQILIDDRSKIFRLICVCGAILTSVQENVGGKVQMYFVKFAKKLRKDLLQRLADFFTHFDSFDFPADDVGAMLDICIFPSIDTNLYTKGKEVGLLSKDLIKFCLALSEIPRFFVLLGTHEPNRFECTLLQLLIDQLNNRSIGKSSRNSIGSILFNLLSLSDFEPGSESGSELSLPERFSLKVACFVSVKSPAGLNFGTRLILPYADRLLAYLSRTATVALCRNEQWMKMLAVLCEFAADPIYIDRLLSILLNIMKSNSIKDTEVQSELLISVYRLFSNLVGDCRIYLKVVAELFSIVEDRTARNRLIDILKLLSTKVDNLTFIASIVEESNTWIIDRLDDPDYEQRIKAFAKINKSMLDCSINPNLDLISCSMWTHNCAFFMSKMSDVGLRDQASNSLQKMLEFASKAFDAQAVRLLLTSHILPILRGNLKTKDEAVRHEFVSLLCACVRFVPEHPKLLGLSKLTDVGDVDLNFFENIRNIQLHRRSRAIRRLCDKLEIEEGEEKIRIHSETLFNYLWPLMRSFIFEPEYRKNSNLVDESLRFLGVYCRRTSWKRYESILKLYLQNLKKDTERQKLMVKIIVVVLDSFHFDISGVEPADQLAEHAHQQQMDPSHQQAEPAHQQQMEVDSQVNDEKSTKKKAIFDAIVKNYLPDLQKSLSKRLSTDFVHKTATKFVYDEDEEILRVPLALAIVKLLQKLPASHLDTNLPGILAKMCQMLKSRSLDIRETTRKMLCRVGEALGSRYASYVIREMRGILTKGYQRHVMIYTLNVFLAHLAPSLKAGDLNPCLKDVLYICNEDLFGDVSAEKEVDEITRKLKEAKINKTNSTYQILGKLIDRLSIDLVLNPLHEVLAKRFSHKVVQRVGEALKYFAQGLIVNEDINIESIMLFVFNLLSKNVAAMLDNGGVGCAGTTQDEEGGAGRTSCYLIDKEPGRKKAEPKKSRNNSLHVLATFALELINSLFKSNKLEPERQVHAALIDPLLRLFVECTNAKQPKVISLSLRCLCWSFKFPAPSLPVLCKSLVDHLFILLKRFAGSASGKGDNFELLNVLFKTLTLIIKDVDYCSLTVDQLKILLHYAEEDLFNVHKQTTAFALIRAILARNLKCDEIKSMMKRIEELSIVSQMDAVRVQCRHVMCRYLTNYVENQRPKQTIEFYCSQLSYEFEEGRISALEMLNSIVDLLKAEALNEFCSMIFIHVALRLVNDESATVKKLASISVKNLLSKIDNQNRSEFFRMILDWIDDDNVMHKKLSAHLMGVCAPFVADAQVLHAFFEAILVNLRIFDKNKADVDDAQVASADHVTYLLLAALEKLFVAHAFIVRDSTFSVKVTEIWGLLMRLIDHQHVWVRLASCRLFGLMFSHYDPRELRSVDINSEEYFLRHAHSTVTQLGRAFIRRFRAVGCAEELSEQVIKNLVYLSRCLRFGLGSSRDSTPTDLDSDVKVKVDAQVVVSLNWMAKQLAKICRVEVSSGFGQITKRKNAFKWFAAMFLDSDAQELNEDLLKIAFSPLHRELTLVDAEPTLKQLAGEVLELAKQKLGFEKYSEILACTQKMASEKKFARKRKLADEVVADPEKAAKRKMRRHKMHSEARKQQFSAKKGKKFKKSTSSLAVIEEFD